MRSLIVYLGLFALLAMVVHSENMISSSNGIKFDLNQDSTTNIKFESDGNLGIGTSSPSQALDVSGNVAVSGNTVLSDALLYSGNGIPMRSIVLTAAGATPAETNGPDQIKSNSSSYSFYSLDFDQSTDESAYWNWVQPDAYSGGNITATLLWHATAGSGNVMWSIQTVGVAAGEQAVTPTLSSSENAVTTTAGANLLNVTTFTEFSPGWAAGDFIVFKLFRDTSEDNLAADAKFIQVKVEYPVSAESD